MYYSFGASSSLASGAASSAFASAGASSTLASDLAGASGLAGASSVLASGSAGASSFTSSATSVKLRRQLLQQPVHFPQLLLPQLPQLPEGQQQLFWHYTLFQPLKL